MVTQKKFVIVKKYDANAVRYNDRKYFREEADAISPAGFVDIKDATFYDDYPLALVALTEKVQDPGTYQIELIYQKTNTNE